jgi:hypothetical protein
MKNLVAILLLTAGTLRLSAQVTASTAPDPNAPVITFDADVIDFGNVVQYSEAVRTFTFTNTGKTDLIITSVKGQCGCTTILPESLPKAPIPPGGKGSFKVQYDTKVRVGIFDKQIMVYSNSATGVVTVKIKGVVVPAGTPATGGN